MAIAFRSKTQTTGSGTSVTGTEPAGTVEGDVLIALYALDATSATITIPSGWTSLQAGSSINYEFRYIFAYIVRGASAPSFAFTHTGSVYRELHILSFSGVNTSSPIENFRPTPSLNAASNNPDAPSVTATSASAMAVAIGAAWAGAPSGFGAPSGYTIRTNNGAGEDVVIATKTLTASGSENPAAFTGTGAAVSDNWAATLLLRPSGPTLVASYSTAYNTTTEPKTLSVTTLPGDIVVVYGGSEYTTCTLNTPTGNSLSYALHQSVIVTDFCPAYIWSATDNSGGTNWTLSIDVNDDGTHSWGATCLVFRDSDGLGASSKTNNTSGDQTVSLTTTQANSAIVLFQGDYAAGSGARTWATVNGITPTSGNGLERDYVWDTGSYTVYGGYYPDVGSVGSKTAGVTAPTGQIYSIVALEVKAKTLTPVSPLLVSEYESAWDNGTTPKTTSITIDATTDVLVVSAAVQDDATTISTPTGGTGVTWNLQQSYTTTGYCNTYLWAATDISPQTFTLSVAATGGGFFGFSCLKFANASVGASNKAQASSGAPLVSLTTTAASSAIVAINSDWNATDATTRTWRTNAGNLTEQTYSLVASTYSSFIGVHPNAGAAGPYDVGLSVPSTMKYSILAVEIKPYSPPGSSALLAWIGA